MDALSLLTEQHEDVDNLIEEIESADKKAEKRKLFAEMADKLAAHAVMEERLFYPAVNAKKTKDLLLEATEEHLAIKRVLADLLNLDVDDEHFDAKMSTLKEEITHHAHEEEEEKLFPKVKQLLSKTELEGLGSEMAALFEELLEQEPRKDVPDQTDKAAPLS